MSILLRFRNWITLKLVGKRTVIANAVITKDTIEIKGKGLVVNNVFSGRTLVLKTREEKDAPTTPKT